MMLLSGTQRFSLVFLFILWAELASFGATQAIPSNAEDWLTRGSQLVAEGKFSEALAIFNSQKQADPKDPRPYFHMGIALAGMGRLSAAASELTEAVRLDPNQPEYRLFQANVLTDLGQKPLASQALAVFEKKETVNGLAAAWMWLLADVYYRLEKADDALRVLEQLSRQNPPDWRLDLNRGQAYLAKGEHELARKFFEKSLEKKPANNALAYFELGKVLHQQSELPSAKKALLEAVKQDETNPQYLHKLGVVCLALNEVEEAIQYLERAEPGGPKLPEVYYALGRAYQKAAKREKAEHYLKRFEEITSAERKKKDRERESGKLITEGEKQLNQGDKTEARALFEQALQIDPKNWSAHGYLAEMALASGAFELAYPHLVKMEEIDPDSAVGNYLMATYWYQQKEYQRARDYAERVKSIRPGNAELRNLLGNIYRALGQEEKALKEFTFAVQLAPDNAGYRENLRAVENRKLNSKKLPPKH